MKNSIALKYILKEKRGLYDNLILKFGEETVVSLKEAGLINSNNKGVFTTCNFKFIEEILPREDFSFLERIQNKINDFVVGK